MKITTQDLIFWIGIAGTIASGVASQFGADSRYGLIASLAVATLAKIEHAIQAYATPDGPTTVINNPPAPVKIVAPLSGTPDVPPKV